MPIKETITVTYTYYLHTENIQEFLDSGGNADEVKRSIKYNGIKSRFVRDYDVTEVESILKDN